MLIHRHLAWGLNSPRQKGVILELTVLHKSSIQRGIHVRYWWCHSHLKQSCLTLAAGIRSRMVLQHFSQPRMKQQDDVPQASGAFDNSRQLNKESRFYPAKHRPVHHALVKQTAASQSVSQSVSPHPHTATQRKRLPLPAAANSGTAAYLSHPPILPCHGAGVHLVKNPARCAAPRCPHPPLGRQRPSMMMIRSGYVHTGRFVVVVWVSLVTSTQLRPYPKQTPPHFSLFRWWKHSQSSQAAPRQACCALRAACCQGKNRGRAQGSPSPFFFYVRHRYLVGVELFYV